MHKWLLLSFFVLENSFHTLLPIQFHLLVMDTENSLWGKKQTASWKKKARYQIYREWNNWKTLFSISIHKQQFIDWWPRYHFPHKTNLWVPKATSTGLTWFFGILNPGFYCCWAGLRRKGASCPLLWVFYLGHGEVRHCSYRPLLSAFKFPARVSLSPSTLRAQSRETVAGNREVLSPRDHSPKGVGRFKTRLPPCLSFS